MLCVECDSRHSRTFVGITYSVSTFFDFVVIATPYFQ